MISFPLAQTELWTPRPAEVPFLVPSQLDGGARCEPEALERPHGCEDDGQPAFHVAAAATVDPVSVTNRLEGCRPPQALGGHIDNIDVTVEDERAPTRAAGRPVCDDVRLPGDVPRER